MSRLALAACLISLSGAAFPAQAQTYFYPTKGQDQAQQSKDVGECQAWAAQQAGGYAAAPPPTGTPRLGGAVRGAAGGAAIGAIAGDAGKGAAIGAVSGVMIGGARARRERRDAEAAASAQSNAYGRAIAACMQGRGYSAG